MEWGFVQIAQKNSGDFVQKGENEPAALENVKYI